MKDTKTICKCKKCSYVWKPRKFPTSEIRSYPECKSRKWQN